MYYYDDCEKCMINHMHYISNMRSVSHAITQTAQITGLPVETSNFLNDLFTWSKQIVDQILLWLKTGVASRMCHITRRLRKKYPVRWGRKLLKSSQSS